MAIRDDLTRTRRNVAFACRVCGLGALVCLGAVAGAASWSYAGDWVITPRVEGQVLFTDNVFATPTDRRSDLITSLAPGIEISGESARLRANLDYSPTFYRYALTPSQNNIAHNLFAKSTATIVPNLLYFDANAYAARLPTTAGLITDLGAAARAPASGLGTGTGPGGLAPIALPKNQLTQTTTALASPYLQHRFGPYGVGEARYTFVYNNLSDSGNLRSPDVTGLDNATQLTHEGTVTFVTGEYFDRFASRVLLDTSRSTGSGGLSDTRQNRAIVATAIPLVDKISALTTIGYENLRYDGAPPIRINGPVWGLGLRFAPTPTRTLTAVYGRRDGITSPYVSLDYAVTPLMRVNATYSDSLTTLQEDVTRNLVLAERVRERTVDRRTLLPLEIRNPLLGLQLNLTRVKRLSAATYLDYKRDYFTLNAYREEDQVISQTSPLSAASFRATAANVGWTHEVNRLTSTQVGLGYARTTFFQVPTVDADIFTFGASVNYLFNPTLSGSAGYTFFKRSSDQQSFRATINLVSISLRKTF